MKELKKYVLEEKQQHERLMNEKLNKYNIVFEGKGPIPIDPSTGRRSKSYVEHEDEDYDPYNQLGYGF